MIFICGIISIITLKNTLCKNKIRVIYFCPHQVSFWLEKAFFSFFGGLLSPMPPSSYAYICVSWITYDALVELADIVLKNNYFQFLDKTFKQKRATAIGTKFAPPYSILIMEFRKTFTI